MCLNKTGELRKTLDKKQAELNKLQSEVLELIQLIEMKDGPYCWDNKVEKKNIQPLNPVKRIWSY